MNKIFNFYLSRILFLLLSLGTNENKLLAQNITKVAGNGIFGYSGDGGLATSAQLGDMYYSYPAFDTNGNMYIAQNGNNTIRRIDPSGIITTIAGSNGIIGYTGDGGPAINALLYHPSAIVVDNNNNIIFSDANGNFLRKINTTTGIISTISGQSHNICGFGDGGLLINARFQAISGLTFDRNNGDLYISDYGCNTIRKVNASGIISTIAGNGTLGFSGDGGLATSAQLAYPSVVAIDAVGNIYIPDAQNHRIRKINTSGIITTFAGNGIQAYSGDGGLPTNASLAFPGSVVIDNAGDIYIGDDYNNVIRKVNGSGIISTFAGNGISGYSGDGGLCNAASISMTEGRISIYNNNLYFVNFLVGGVIRKISNCSNATITQQPADINLCNGGNPTFSLTATNVTAYQWQENVGTVWNNITNNAIYLGTTTNTLSIIGASAGMNNNKYRCALTNSCGTSYSNFATLTVSTPAAPSITINTASSSICAGALVTFTATSVQGGSNPIYQWMRNGIYVGTNSNIYSNSSLVNGDIIACTLVSNASCLTTPLASSNSITSVVTTPVAPTISVFPSSTTICAGTLQNFTAIISNGGSSPSFQWKKNGISVGLNSPTYSSNSINNGDLISCTLTSSQSCLLYTSVTGNSPLITINPTLVPSINISADNNNICQGISTTFSATVNNSGTNPIYQWKKNGLNVGSNTLVYIDNALNNGDNIQCLLIVAGGCFSLNSIMSNSVQMSIMQPVQPTVTISTPKLTICKSEPVTFNSIVTNNTLSTLYQWVKNGINVGVNSSTYLDSTINNGDEIKLNITTTINNNCIAVRTVTSNTVIITIRQNPIVTLDKKNSICDGGNSSLDAGDFSSYLWNNGSTQRFLNVTGIGNYYVTVKDNFGCIGSDTVRITNVLPKPVNFSPLDTSICSFESIELKAKNGYKHYLWNDLSIKSSLLVKEPGEYSLTVTDTNNCKSKEIIKVSQKNGCVKGFHIPNAFSPNQDFKNDNFKPLIFGKVLKYRFIIFNRYGLPIFETTDVHKGWDGKVKGVVGNSNGFVWFCNYQIEGEKEVIEKGTVLMIK